jgi:hypothetical protein
MQTMIAARRITMRMKDVRVDVAMSDRFVELQMRINDVRVEELPKFLSDAPTDYTHALMTVSDPFVAGRCYVHVPDKGKALSDARDGIGNNNIPVEKIFARWCYVYVQRTRPKRGPFQFSCLPTEKIVTTRAPKRLWEECRELE